MVATRLQGTLEAIDALNAEDPNQESADGRDWPKELLYGQRMSERLRLLEPAPSEALQIAVRAQHVQRWKIPRDEYPMDRSGYKRWRLELSRLHAEIAAGVMRRAGYDNAEIERVERMLRKEQLKRDVEVQTLEDVACLVFLQHYFGEFAARHPHDKVISIVRKTWNKMSERGHAAALQLDLADAAAALVQEALGDG